MPKLSKKMRNRSRISRKEAKENNVSNLDALELVGEAASMFADKQSALSAYIQENAIQVEPPKPAKANNSSFATDSCNANYPSSQQPVNQAVLAYFISDSSFIGYYAMASIAQNWLVMKGCSQKSEDAMKKGYKLTQNDGESLEPEKLREIAKLDKKYKINKNMVEGVTFNNIFGIRHILFKHTDPDFDYALPFNPDSFKGGKYAGISQIDPYWVVPELDDQDITDPTAINYYDPTFWVIGSKRYHKSHFVILRGEEVSDYLKPTYRYGGISMVQRVYQRAYAAERTSNEIPQLVMTKRMTVRKTDLAKMQANKSQFVKNLNAMTEFRDNFGTNVVGLGENIEQIDTSLTDLDDTMWTQYHLVASIFDMPVSKLYGTGINGFASGETDEDYYLSSLEALQANKLDDIAYSHYQRLMPSEFKKDMDLDILWNPLKVMSDKDRADVNYINSQTAANLFAVGAIGEVDERDRLIADENSGYSGMEKLEAFSDLDKENDLVNNDQSPDGEVTNNATSTQKI